VISKRSCVDIASSINFDSCDRALATGRVVMHAIMAFLSMLHGSRTRVVTQKRRRSLILSGRPSGS